MNLALDPDERPVLAYFDAREHALRVARKSADGWSFEVLMTGRMYGYNDFYVDRWDRIHLNSYRTPGWVLTYGLFDGESWTFEEPWVGRPHWLPGIVVDSTGRPFLTFGESASGNAMWVASREPEGWDVNRVHVDDGMDAEMAVDGIDRVYLSYVSFPSDLFLVYQTLPSWEWRVETVSQDVYYYDHDIRVTANGDVFIAALLDSSKELRLFARPVGADAWEIETIDTRYGRGGRVSMSMVEDDPIVYYVDYDLDGIYSRMRRDGVWQPEEVVLPPQGGIRLVLDSEMGPDGTEHISFLLLSEDKIVYGSRPPYGEWTFQTIDSQSGPMTGQRLHLTTYGDPLVLYYDLNQEDLKLARWIPPTPHDTHTPTTTPPPTMTPTATRPPSPWPSPGVTATPTATPSPGASPTATSPPSPTPSPKPSPTTSPRPTATARPTPDQVAPYILLGGWAGTALEADRPGLLTLAALVEGADVARVVLTELIPDGRGWQVADLDLELERYPDPLPGFPDEIALYLLTLENVTVPAGRYLPCGLRAYDLTGNASEVWPFLEAILRPGGPACSSAQSELLAGRLSSALPALAGILRQEHRRRAGAGSRPGGGPAGPFP
jgi:hypothetical protein